MYLKVTIENEAYCPKSTNHLREALSKWVKQKVTSVLAYNGWLSLCLKTSQPEDDKNNSDLP